MTAARIVTLLSATLYLMPIQAVAQRLQDKLQSFEPEVRLRIRTINYGIHIGRLERVASDTVYLQPQRGSSAVGIDAIDRVWVRGTATKKGAVIGGVTGAALGALSFAMFSYGVCDAAQCSVDVGATVTGAVVVGLVGAATGAVFGAMFGQWHPKFP
jgi:hypothetical protein